MGAMPSIPTADLIGYTSSLVLLLTIGYQVTRQARSGTSRGVSPLLFAGQLVASIGFTVYSALIDNVIFVATNACLGLAAIAGLVIVTLHRRFERRSSIAHERREVELGAGGDVHAERLAHDRERALVSGAGDRGGAVGGDEAAVLP